MIASKIKLWDKIQRERESSAEYQEYMNRHAFKYFFILAAAFINALYTFLQHAATTYVKIANVWNTCPFDFKSDGITNQQTQTFVVSIKETAQLIINCSATLAPLYADVGAALYAFRNSFIRF